MSMLGFVYLVLILGWILIVVFLKCKKSITPHLGFGDNYTDALGNTDRRPSVHVIQLPPEEIEQEEHYMNSLHRQSYSHRSQRSTLEERNVEIAYPTDAIINHAYMHDEDYVINAPPPSYDEVMRQPDVYPQVQNSSSKSSVAHM